MKKPTNQLSDALQAQEEVMRQMDAITQKVDTGELTPEEAVKLADKLCQEYELGNNQVSEALHTQQKRLKRQRFFVIVIAVIAVLYVVGLFAGLFDA